MKQLLALLLAVFTTNFLLAQSVGIGTTTPNTSAQLDISSTTKGLLIPRMTGAQRAAIAATLTNVGMMVIQTNTETSPPSSPGLYLLERVGLSHAWRRIARTDEISGGSSTWTINGIDQYSNVVGNVGIGTSSPIRTLHIKGDFQVDTGAVIFNTPGAILQFQNGAVNKTFLQQSGNNLRIGTSPNNELGKLIFRMDGSDKIFIDSTGNMQIIGEQDASLTANGYLTLGNLSGRNIVLDNNEIMARDDSAASDLQMQYNGGNVGIGAVTPDERLTFTGNAKLVGAAGLIKFETAVGGTGSPVPVSRYVPGLQFLRENTTTQLAKIEYVDTSNFANFIRLRMGSNIENGITLNSSNHTGIGTNDPLARLHIKGETDIDEIAIHAGNGLAGQTAAIQFYNTPLVFGAGAGGPGTKKGFLMLDDEDFKIGTNSGNSAGKFIIRNNGGDRVFVDGVGNVGIGTEPAGTARLLVLGKSLFSQYGGEAIEAIGRITVNKDFEAIKINGNDPAINFFEGNVQKGYLWMINNDMNLGTSVAGGKINMATSQVTIGTSIATPGDYKLGVGGKVICEEVKVKLQNNGWPDYVFSQDYKLKSLEEVEKFIQQHKHLPNIPSAATIEKDGLMIGDMQKRMMEKIEELTLYIIDLQKQVDDLKKIKQ